MTSQYLKQRVFESETVFETNIIKQYLKQYQVTVFEKTLSIWNKQVSTLLRLLDGNWPNDIV